MSDDITAQREEVAALRGELTELRKEHRKLLYLVGVLPGIKFGPWPDYLHFLGPHGARAVSVCGSEDGGGIIFHDVDGTPKSRLP